MTNSKCAAVLLLKTY